ncbi:MAG: hypothetical protein HYS27_10510 [Deltaproteobacteria bacterium]|nr:hypothetical protein [Deltaproteobacteria bacterium]
MTALARAARSSVALALMVAPLLVSAPGCLFLPNLAGHGYTPCDDDSACPPGRFCDESLCAPPPWHDQAFGRRRAVIVANPAASPIPAGAAVPIVVGGETGVLALAELGASFRFTDYDRASASWRVVSVYLDRESDRFTAWIPTAREIPAGGSALLAFVESNAADGLPHVSEDPAATFAQWQAFDAPLADDTWFQSPAGGPVVQDGMVNVADNQAIVLQAPLVPPVLAVLVARINGATCDEVFLGLVGDDRALFQVPPEAGIFVGSNLQGTAQLAPTSDSTPTDVGDGLTVVNAMARTVVAIDGGAVLVEHAGATAFADPDLRPPFGADPLYLAVQVGGACSVDVDAVWTTPLPQPFPTVTVEAPVDFNLAYEN